MEFINLNPFNTAFKSTLVLFQQSVNTHSAAEDKRVAMSQLLK